MNKVLITLNHMLGYGKDGRKRVKKLILFKHLNLALLNTN